MATSPLAVGSPLADGDGDAQHASGDRLLLTARETADVLRCSVWTLRRWRAAGHLAVLGIRDITTGGRRRYNAASVYQATYGMPARPDRRRR